MADTIKKAHLPATAGLDLAKSAVSKRIALGKLPQQITSLRFLSPRHKPTTLLLSSLYNSISFKYFLPTPDDNQRRAVQAPLLHLRHGDPSAYNLLPKRGPDLYTYAAAAAAGVANVIAIAYVIVAVLEDRKETQQRKKQA
ncbi:hypothetical protein BC937DRAFT_89279 [Endogone sp. FLAS-F59071]|nr:hypothetical protein BC937DRAFT_89279 [Endogone sp. FLAS-F59071]|eukprot:RUS23286.1 hypothetical protein BC937DRAFT_89279 [Endogone sp. FLAS-F59071]